MNDWTPGEGWRKTDDFAHAEVVWYPNGQTEGGIAWVREVPVPPLPTVPYTVIRATYGENVEVLALTEDGRWWSQELGVFKSDAALVNMTGFEVLSEPRVATASAIFRRMREYNGLIVGESDEFDSLEREFGVES